MQPLFKKFGIFVALFSIAQSANADLLARPNDAQITDDVRIFLKKAQQAEQQFLVENGKFTLDLASIGVMIPYYLLPFGSVKVVLGASSLKISFVGALSAPLFGKTFSINESGVVAGAAQFSSANELNEELKSLLEGVYTAEKSYFVEVNAYTIDLAMAGVVVPEYLSKLGKLSLSVSPDGFVATFTGAAYPIANRVFKVDQDRLMKGF